MATQTLGELLIKIGADVGDMRAKFEDVNKRLDSLVKKTDATGAGFSRFEARTVTLNAALDLAGKAFGIIESNLGRVADFLTESVSAAQQEEEIFTRLNATLRASGQFTEAYAAALRNLASQLELATGIEGEAIGQTQTLLVALGAAPREIEPLIRSAIALARTFDVDLDQAARRLILGVEGNVEALSRFGIEIGKTATRTERFAGIQKQITENFADAGSVSRYGESVRGVSIAWDDFRKAVGGVLTATPELQGLLETVSLTLREMSGALDEDRGKFISLAGDGIALAVESLGVLQVALFDVAKLIEVSGHLTTDFVNALRSIAAGESITPIADAIGASIEKTIEFQARFEAAADRIRQKAAEAAGAQGDISEAAQRAALSSERLGPALEGVGTAATNAAGQISRAAQSSARDGATLVRSAREAAASLNDFDVANDALGSLRVEVEKLKGEVEGDPVRVLADIADAQQKLQRLEPLIDNATGTRRLVLVAETEAAQQEIGEVIDLIEQARGRRGVEVAVDTQRAQERLRTLESDIGGFASGRLPAAVVNLDISNAERALQELRNNLAAAKTDAEREAIQVKIDAETGKLDELKAKFQEVAQSAAAVGTSLEQAMTRAIESAQKARVELANAFGDAMGGHFAGDFAGATSNIDVSGAAAATGAELQAQAQDFAESVASAVEAADIGSLQKQQAALRDFLDNYQDGLTLIGDAAAKNAVGVFRTLEAEIGRLLQSIPNVTSGLSALGAIAATPSLGAGAVSFDDARIVDRLAEQNALARETNDRLADQATATRSLASGLASGGFAADTTKTQKRSGFLGGTLR